MLKKIIHYLLRLWYPVFKKAFPYQLYAYLAVGAANTLLNIGLFTLGYSMLSSSGGWLPGITGLKGFAVEIATVLSFLVSVITGFWLSKNFAFTDAPNEKEEQKKQFGRYFLVSLQGQFSDYLITKGLIIFLRIEPAIAYCISTVIMLVINFMLQKYYTFKAQKPR